MYVILIHQRHTHRRTDIQTDGRHAIAIPRFALYSVLRCKNTVDNV